MDDLSEIVNRLTEHARSYQLAERATDGCALLLLNNQEQENGLPEGMSISAIEIRFGSHALFFDKTVLSYPYIVTHLDLLADDERVGFYKLITSLEGQVEDDYLVFDPE